MITGRANTLIIPTDEVAVKQCQKHRLPCVIAGAHDHPTIKIWGDIGFIKYYAMALIASLGLDFIFSEMDVVILQDPWPYHEREDDVQWRKGDCRHYVHTAPGRSPQDNPRAEDAEIQVSSHFNHPRVNIGYIYVRWSVETMNFLLQLAAYHAGKCADDVLGFDHKAGTYIDLGLPDQNFFDALLRNHDHGHPKYYDMPWDAVPQVRWKLLDYNLFGIFGRHDAPSPWVTFHYAGEGRKVPCWSGICEQMRRHRTRAWDQLHPTRCAKQWTGGKCVDARKGNAAHPNLQWALEEYCIGAQIKCSRER